MKGTQVLFILKKDLQMKKNVVCLSYSKYYHYELLKIDDNLGGLDNLRLIKDYGFKDIKRKQGFLLILTVGDIENYYDLSDIYLKDCIIDVYKFDRLYRKKLGKFEYTIIISEEEIDSIKIPFTNTYVVYANDYIEIKDGLNPLIRKIYQDSLHKKEIKYTKKRKDNIEKLRKCINKLNKDYFKTEDIIKRLGVNRKWIQRYMKDMNLLYNNIGYDRRKRVWYLVKTTEK